ncbi:MAG: hypothetical protein ABJD11_00575 [Gemmatimonadota bacterium]
MKPRALMFGLLALVACGYNNGMYNANRLAKEATRADREGRTIDASGLWGQVAVKAESLLIRRPKKNSIVRLRFLRGMGLSRTGDCATAVPFLEDVANEGDKGEMVEQATALLGECRMALGDPAGASIAYGRLIGSADRSRRHKALLRHGRALRLDGDYAQALVELNQSEEPAALGERAAALAGLGNTAALMAVADSLIARGDTAAPWDATLELLGAHDEAAASALVERLRASPKFSPVEEAGWVYGDGLRLLKTDTTRGLARLAELQRIRQGGSPTSLARLAIVRFHLDRADSLAEIRTALATLEDMQEGSGAAAGEASTLAGRIRRVLASTDSQAPELPARDMQLFLAAETTRDSLRAPVLAAALFGQVARDWPESPFAPKALMAVAELDSIHADSVWAILRSRYADSPYLAILRGEDPPAFRQLEDSLRHFASVTPPSPIRTPARKPGAPTSPAARKPADVQ